jgi:hypothetical protein
LVRVNFNEGECDAFMLEWIESCKNLLSADALIEEVSAQQSEAQQMTQDASLATEYETEDVKGGYSEDRIRSRCWYPFHVSLNS